MIENEPQAPPAEQPAAPQQRSTPQPDAVERISFEEFRLYYESAERVTDRRHELNRWNYSIVVATLAAIGVVLNWATNDPSRVLIGVCGIMILCVTAVGLCTFWIRQISDFKALNAAKFRLLNEMAPKLLFTDDNDVKAISYRPFEREWDQLKDEDVLVKVSDGRLLHLLALSASRAEYFIPKALRAIFVAILVTVIVLSIVSRDVIFAKISPFG